MNGARLAWLAGLFFFLVAWAWVWPFTGDGDSALHYLTSVRAVDDPKAVLTSWARPLYASIMVLPSLGGILCARAFNALLTVLLVWQTIRMAEDFGVKRSALAGLFVVCQPLAFALASDTMTEIPMALSIVVALRLWRHRRHTACCVWVSFLPLVRPEGFFLGVLWGAMLLVRRDLGPWWSRRLPMIASLLTGCVVWSLACWAITGDFFHVVHAWSWPAGSYESYGRGSLFHHVVRWPDYCGPLLLPLFLIGIFPSVRARSMRLPWAVWWIVFGVHSVLWWGGWFAALGMMRIQVAASPVTALVCLFGWNWIAERLPRRAQRPIGVVALILTCLYPLAHYMLQTRHYRCFAVLRAAAYIREHHADAPRFVSGDEIGWAVLGVPLSSEKRVENLWGRKNNLARFAEQPAGTIALWDSLHSVQWRDVTVQDLERLGYETMRVETQAAPDRLRPVREPLMTLRCTVLRKTTPPGEPPADLPATAEGE